MINYYYSFGNLIVSKDEQYSRVSLHCLCVSRDELRKEIN